MGRAVFSSFETWCNMFPKKKTHRKNFLWVGLSPFTLESTVHIHPTAVIEPGAKLGAEVTVGPFAYIANDTSLGPGCCIGPHVTIHPYTILESACCVHAGAVIGDLPQDLAFKGDISFVKVGARTTLREGVTVHRGSGADTSTVVGEDCFLMANSHVGHNAVLGNRVIMANGALVGGYAEIGDRAFISGNCMIHQFTRVGRLAMLAGGAAAQKDIPPFCMTQSSATSILTGLNVVGLRRAGFSSTERQQLKAAFKLLFCSGLLVSTAVERLEASGPSAHVQELCDFIKASKRGVSKAFKSKTRPSDHLSDQPKPLNETRLALSRAFHAQNSDEASPEQVRPLDSSGE